MKVHFVRDIHNNSNPDRARINDEVTSGGAWYERKWRQAVQCLCCSRWGGRSHIGNSGLYAELVGVRKLVLRITWSFAFSSQPRLGYRRSSEHRCKKTHPQSGAFPLEYRYSSLRQIWSVFEHLFGTSIMDSWSLIPNGFRSANVCCDQRICPSQRNPELLLSKQ